MRVNNVSSDILEVTSGVHQGAHPGRSKFCIFMKNFNDFLQFSDLFIFADFEVFSRGQDTENHYQLDGVEKCVDVNEMRLAMEKC